MPSIDPFVFGLPSKSLCPWRAVEKIVHILDNILITFYFRWIVDDDDDEEESEV